MLRPGPSRPKRFSILPTNRGFPTKYVGAKELPGAATSVPSARLPERDRQYTAQPEDRNGNSAGHNAARAATWTGFATGCQPAAEAAVAQHVFFRTSRFARIDNL